MIFYERSALRLKIIFVLLYNVISIDRWSMRSKQHRQPLTLLKFMYEIQPLNFEWNVEKGDI